MSTATPLPLNAWQSILRFMSTPLEERLSRDHLLHARERLLDLRAAYHRRNLAGNRAGSESGRGDRRVCPQPTAATQQRIRQLCPGCVSVAPDYLETCGRSRILPGGCETSLHEEIIFDRGQPGDPQIRSLNACSELRHQSPARCSVACSGKPCLAACLRGIVSQARCSIDTRVCAPTGSKQTSTSVECSAEKFAWRQANTSRLPGSQTEMRPISNVEPSSNVVISRPPSPDSKASWPSPVSPTLKRPLGCHHEAICCVNTSNARIGSAGTRRARKTFDVIFGSSARAL